MYAHLVTPRRKQSIITNTPLVRIPSILCVKIDDPEDRDDLEKLGSIESRMEAEIIEHSNEKTKEKKNILVLYHNFEMKEEKILHISCDHEEQSMAEMVEEWMEKKLFRKANIHIFVPQPCPQHSGGLDKKVMHMS